MTVQKQKIKVASLCLIGLTLILLTAACKSTVTMTPADDAQNPTCASVMLALPDQIGDNDKQKTDAQATSAWGTAGNIKLRCGVNPPGPTTDRCVSVNGVDWVMKQSSDHWTLTTYGRKPAVEINLNNKKESSSTALADISPAVSHITPYAKCSSLADTQ